MSFSKAKSTLLLSEMVGKKVCVNSRIIFDCLRGSSGSVMRSRKDRRISIKAGSLQTVSKCLILLLLWTCRLQKMQSVVADGGGGGLERSDIVEERVGSKSHLA